MTSSRTTQTYEKLKSDLLDARYAPGSKLKIDRLGDEFEVSPSAVREALSRLTSDGLVVAEPQRGFIVAPISAEDLIDLTAVRIDIEMRCLRRAIQIGDVAWEARIVAALHQLNHRAPVDCGPEGRRVMNRDWTRLHSEFHDSLIAACDSRWWLRLRDQLYLQAERYRRLLAPYAKVDRDVDAEHAAIAEAVIARQADRACDLLETHLRQTADSLLASEAPFDDILMPERRHG